MVMVRCQKPSRFRPGPRGIGAISVVLLDVYFRPLTLSDAFYVTDLDGMLLRKGRITDEGVDCLSMRGEGEAEDGELYTLWRVRRRG